MKEVTIDHGNGHSTTYKIMDSGTAFHIDTPNQVCEILDSAMQSRQRLKVYYGDKKTGRDWHEEHDTTGRIGRSTGNVKIPLIIHNSRSYGGPGLLDHCIVKVKDMKTKTVLYQHEKYKAPVLEICESDLPEYLHAIKIDGKIYSRHKSLLSAQRLKAKLS